MNSARITHDPRDERIDVIADINALIVWRAAPDGAPLDSCEVSEVLPDDTPHDSEAWLEAVHPDDREKVRPLWRKAIGSGAVFHAFYRLLQPDGSYRWCNGCGVPLLNDDGSIREWIGTVADIDDQVRVKESLRRSEERLRLALETTRIGIWDSDLVSGEVWCSETTAEIVGHLPDLPLSVADAWPLVHPDDRAFLHQRVQAAISAADGRFEAEFRMIHTDTGEAVQAECSGRVLFDDAGKPVRVLGTIRDVGAGRA
jgi:PAS domain S-box-containing protein